ncbi:acyltransferase [Agrococcus terreus]|uniref:Acyltransferase n=2 Tax=Agrococcus terreus TaxID=574649 RepID=A0ABQ2KEQ6_9MICO|nr:acyltransferase [Agrococcus terreus]
MLAVVSVIANHASGWPIGGFVGVDVFFVISGFLITGLLLREHDRTGRISFSSFYRRRIKRLMPAALTVLLVTVLIGAFVLPRTRAVEAAIDSVFAALFSVNWRLATVGTDYFAAGQAPSPIQHYWSLSVEEQFYVVWPIIIVLVLWAAGRAAIGRAGRGAIVLGAASLITVASFAWAMWETRADEAFAYFSTISRAWELGVGAIVAIVAQHSSRRIPAAIAPWAGLVGTAGILMSFLVVVPSPGFPAPSGLLPVLSTALVLAAGLTGGERYERVNVLLTNRLANSVGDISYSLYLWHFPVIVLGAAFVAQDSGWFLVGAVAVTVVLAAASYRWIEDPARRSAWLTPTWRWTPRIAGASAAVAALVVVAIAATGIRLATPPAEAQPGDVAVASCVGYGALANGCGPDDLTGLVTPSPDRLTQDTGDAYACWREEGTELETCSLGSDAADARRVAIIGDSHAAMLMPAIEPELEELGWSLDTFIGYGCQWRVPDPSSDCAAVMDEASARVSSGDYDVIITTAARWSDSGSGAVDAYAEAWSRAAAGGSRVVVVGDAPTVSEEALACVARVGFDPREDDCSTPREEAMQPVDPLVAASERVEGAELVEVADLYCSGDSCPAAIGGVLVYRDAVGHVTATYMRSAGPTLVERIATAAG